MFLQTHHMVPTVRIFGTSFPLRVKRDRRELLFEERADTVGRQSSDLMQSALDQCGSAGNWCINSLLFNHSCLTSPEAILKARVPCRYTLKVACVNSTPCSQALLQWKGWKAWFRSPDPRPIMEGSTRTPAGQRPHYTSFCCSFCRTKALQSVRSRTRFLPGLTGPVTGCAKPRLNTRATSPAPTVEHPPNEERH